MIDGRSRWTIGVAAVALAMAGCDADAGEQADANAALAPVGVEQARLATSMDGNWINLSGTVITALPASFVLDYGPDNVTVEMDDWDWYKEGRLLNPGDEVVVTGKVDQNLFLEKRIEASSVYVEDLGTYFYASGADEENLAVSSAYVTDADNYADFNGVVTAVEGREFTIGSTAGAIRIDTAQMAENPLDGEGFLKLGVGDRVYVWGDLDLGSRERPEVMAKGVVKLMADDGPSA